MITSPRRLPLPALLLAFATCAPSGDGGSETAAAPPPPEAAPMDRTAIEEAVRAVLADQVEAWNRNDIPAFMDGYAGSARFVSGGSVIRGREEVEERYRRNYPDAAAMGRLEFLDLEVTPLSSEYAVAFGGYRLEREADAPTGLFSLLLRKTSGGWRIIHDHTSSGE